MMGRHIGFGCRVGRQVSFSERLYNLAAEKKAVKVYVVGRFGDEISSFIWYYREEHAAAEMNREVSDRAMCDGKDYFIEVLVPDFFSATDVIEQNLGKIEHLVASVNTKFIDLT